MLSPVKNKIKQYYKPLNEKAHAVPRYSNKQSRLIKTGREKIAAN
jgi:selenocysteine lyase/cysteine desulfurase